MRALLAALALLAAAVGVHLGTPDEDEKVAPFVVTADLGEWGEARVFDLRAEDAALAAALTDLDGWSGATDGVWVVVAATVDVDLEPATLAVSLYLGDVQYDASSRSDAALTQETFSPGLPLRGDLLFEVPRSALDEHGAEARLRVALAKNPRLDSVVEVPLDLSDLETEPTREVASPERVAR